MRWLIIIVTLSLAGCSEDPGGPGGVDGLPCGPANCAGCCNYSECVTQPTGEACGTAGFPCVACQPTEICKEGQCVPSGGKCDSTTCPDGCCQGGQCLDGNRDNACGKGGSACQDCAASQQTCDSTAGTCIGGPSCGPGSCTGCCEGSQCLGGSSDSACGKGGSACQDCAASQQTCDSTTGTCSTPSCGPGSCTGCCQGSQCLGGTSDSACGKGGSACQDCAASQQTCDSTAGTCIGGPGCGPGSCNGCCQGSQCLGGTSDSACGIGGVQCQDCTASSKTCEAASGLCSTAPPCGPGNCSGCCDGNNCKLGNSKSTCGSGGAACATCATSFELCTFGNCVVDSTSKFDLKVINASINQAKVWDPSLSGDSQKPDPYFGIDWASCSKWSIDSPCSSTESNTHYPYWDFKLGTFTASEIKTSWCAFVGDGDGLSSCTPPFNSIGLCAVSVSDADLVKGSKTLTSCPHPDDGNNYITYLKFTFTHAP